MPKQIRGHEPGSRHFVIFGTYKRRRFLAPDRTKDNVVEALQKCMKTHGTYCAGFVVMPNRVHAILFGDETFNISSFVQGWKKTSSYRIKKFNEGELDRYLDSCPGDGPVWQPGFYDFNADSDKKHNEKSGYMHDNPVVDNLVEERSGVPPVFTNYRNRSA